MKKKLIVTGHAQPLDEPILTPNGFINMGNLTHNDYVFSETGHPIKIKNIIDFDELEMYEIQFSDGTSTRCCVDHLWKIQTKKGARTGKYKVIPLRDMLGKINNKKQGNYYRVKCVEPIIYQEQKFIIHPWLLGYILGNGCSLNNQLNITLDKKDVDFVLSKINTNEIISVKNIDINTSRIRFCDVLRNEYERLELTNVKSQFKYIPQEYLNSSIQQRIELLNGLMDSDGTCRKKYNSASFCTTSVQLCQDIIFLIRSLGGKANYYKCDRTTNGKGVEYYISVITSFNPFSLPRKAELYQPKQVLFKNIISANYIGKFPGRCIQVDSEEQLYVTKDFIVTHNCRHGKDTVCKLIEKLKNYNWISSSDAANEIVVFDKLKSIYNYQSLDECFNDRHNHRNEWYDIITEFNNPLFKLGQIIFETHNIYCGIRNKDEFQALKQNNMFEYSIWVDASKRKPLEPSNSMTITKEMCDLVIDNNDVEEKLILNVREIIEKLKL